MPSIITLDPFFSRLPRPDRTWDILGFVYFLSLKQCLRPISYCDPPHLRPQFNWMESQWQVSQLKKITTRIRTQLPSLNRNELRPLNFIFRFLESRFVLKLQRRQNCSRDGLDSKSLLQGWARRTSHQPWLLHLLFLCPGTSLPFLRPPGADLPPRKSWRDKWNSRWQSAQLDGYPLLLEK